MFSNEHQIQEKSGLSGTKYQTTRFAAAILASAISVAGFSAPATAQTVTQVEFDGSKARVNLSGALLTLNQTMASSACRIGADVDVENAQNELLTARVAFAEIIKALRESDTSIGIPTPERKARILASIWKLEQIWVKQKFAATKIREGIRVQEYVNVIAELSPSLDEAATELGSEILAQYTNPAELLTGDALTISVAARQRMLTQKMAKEFCGIATAQAKFGTNDTFAPASNLFDKSLSALYDGFPAAGVSAPPNDFIKNELNSVRTDWDGVKASWQGAKSKEGLPKSAETLRNLQRNMDNVVTLYMLATPGSSDVYRVPLEAYAEFELAGWMKNPELIEAIKAQNASHRGLAQSQVDSLDKQWRAEVKSDGAKPLVDKLLSHPSSLWLAQKQRESAGLVTEVFVMDDKGLNVSQSAATSDYWQGDEAKWKETFGKKSDDIHISEVEFDDSTGAYQSQVSMTVRDPETNAPIGAVTFGVNVQQFL